MNVTVYSTPTCPYCKLVKDFLKENSIAFSEIDVASDTAAANEMVKMSGQMGVPVIKIDDEIIVGWNKSALEEVIKSKQKGRVAA
ncbi:MAG TPA: glutaredoxin domain-containing protein [Patescibacteria group bacterium]|nr:glutaredoxin domain-containing protein [Patescibacteria group bacterium]